MRAVEGHPVWEEIAPEIQAHEFHHPHLMSVTFLRKLSQIRREAGVPFRFVSDHRPPERNAAVGGVRGSAHSEDPCEAVDLRVLNSRERYKIVQAAIAAGIARIGVYPPTAGQKRMFGKNSGSIHLDDAARRPVDVMWVSS